MSPKLRAVHVTDVPERERTTAEALLEEAAELTDEVRDVWQASRQRPGGESLAAAREIAKLIELRAKLAGVLVEEVHIAVADSPKARLAAMDRMRVELARQAERDS